LGISSARDDAEGVKPERQGRQRDPTRATTPRRRLSAPSKVLEIWTEEFDWMHRHVDAGLLTGASSGARRRGLHMRCRPA
jgi:hypothetical protein